MPSLIIARDVEEVLNGADDTDRHWSEFKRAEDKEECERGWMRLYVKARKALVKIDARNLETSLRLHA